MKIMSEVSSLKLNSALITFCISLCAPLAYAESLYSDTSYRGLVGDIKASHVGDSLTVLIVENSKGETSNDTGTNESSGNAVSGSNTSNTESFALDSTSTYKSGGEITRTGNLLARITVTVHEVLPTGELRVKGEQNIKINDEQQAISLTGNIRPIDISATNTVVSTRLANAKITYQGQGYTSDEPGLFTDFFRWLF